MRQLQTARRRNARKLHVAGASSTLEVWPSCFTVVPLDPEDVHTPQDWQMHRTAQPRTHTQQYPVSNTTKVSGAAAFDSTP